MTPDEVALVLTKASAVDRRTIGEADVMAWFEILERAELADALEAVKRHYATERDWIMPADVLRISRIVRDERREHSEPLALPGRFETDEERDARMKEGMAKVRKAIVPVVAKLSMERERTWQKSRKAAAGAWWEDETSRERHAQRLLAEQGRLYIRCGDESCQHCRHYPEDGDHAQR